MLNQLLLPQAGEYVTSRQALEEGHPVKKGEKASMVFFFKFIDAEDKDTWYLKSGSHRYIKRVKFEKMLDRIDTV